MIEDKRKYQRIPFFAVATVIAKSNLGAPSIKTDVNNISEVGMGIRSSEYLDTGTEVSIEIEFTAEGKKEKDIMEGKVVWKIELHNVYLMGIFFNEPLSPEKQPGLYEYFKKGLSQSND